jgi:putative SOS response-associated peptidase YedK
MCGRYVLVQKIEVIEKKFNVINSLNLTWESNYNISPGQLAPVIADDAPDKIQLFRFGLVPFWSTKDSFLINARTEGDQNKEDDPNYGGAKGIIIKPAFRKAIRSQRCLVPADAFIEGTTKEKLSKPYLVYLKEKVRPFAFAGIWDEWTNPVTGEIIRSFAIITTVSNSLLQKIPHHRSPVILPRWAEQRWLKSKLALTDVTAMLKPYPAELMNAYPISSEIKTPGINKKELIQPIGERLLPEGDISINKEVRLEGMGSNKRFGFNKDHPWG